MKYGSPFDYRNVPGSGGTYPPLWWRNWGRTAYYGFTSCVAFAVLLNWMAR